MSVARREPAWRRAIATPFGCLGFIIVTIIVATAALSPWITPYNPSALAIQARLQPPTLAHPFGTDQLGRDTLSRVIVGARIALETALTAVGLAGAVGAALGMLAGYGPAWLDHALVLLFDTLRAFPTVMLALALVTLIGPSLVTVVLVVVATFSPGYGRMLRAQTQVLKHSDFIVAAHAVGAGAPRILARHVLPNIFGPLLVLASMDLPVAITIEAGLSFLGFGVRPPTPSWGTVLNDGYVYIGNTPWLILAGGLPLVVSTLGFTFLGEAMRDAVDPRLRREP